MSSQKPKNVGWIYYFALVLVLTVVATVTLGYFNLKQQLTLEKTQAAIALWEKNGPADYIVAYSSKRNGEGGDSHDHYVVKVKAGKAIDVLLNGRPLEEERQLAYYGMHRLLAEIERFHEMDAEKGRPKVYVRGQFDGTNGRLFNYVRRVMGTPQRLEIVVESFTPAPPEK